MSKIKDGILKQHNIGQFWGRFALAGSQIAIVVSTLTLLMAATSAYPSVSTWLAGYGVHMRFWVFITIIVVPIVIAYFLSWKFLVRSFYRSSTEQFWNQDNPLITKLDNIEKTLCNDLPEIKKRLSELENKWK